MASSAKPLRIALVAGEPSGDTLGASLIRALKTQNSELSFEGIGGPQMIAEGMQSWFPMERLSVMGLVEVLGRLKELLGIRRQLRERWSKKPPAVFIGIDAPDFNLTLERHLREAGIPTVHYVSPSVWAWREKRVFKIAKAVDLMLCLLPFEKAFYDKHGVDARFIGHTLADEIPLEVDAVEARSDLGLALDRRYVALLPGSRSAEVAKLGPLFLDTAKWLMQKDPNLQFLIPAANEARMQQMQALLEDQNLPVTLFSGQSRRVMAAADVVLMASGTAALEAMLLKKATVVSYRVSPITAFIMRRLLKTDYVALPNLLANEMLMPELLQQDAQVPALGEAVWQRLDNPSQYASLQQRFTELHQMLRRDASLQAANAVLELISRRAP